jgi:hypothetical protein
MSLKSGIFASKLRTGDNLAVSRTNPDILEMFPPATDYSLRDCPNLCALVAAEVEHSGRIRPYGVTELHSERISRWSRITFVNDDALPVDTNCTQTH